MNANNYGHWDTRLVGQFEPRDYLYFTYRITFDNGDQYIGVKKLWRSVDRTPSSYKRRNDFKPSDWLKYKSSSNACKQRCEDETPEYLILELFTSKAPAIVSELLLTIDSKQQGQHLLNESIYLPQIPLSTIKPIKPKPK
ncbi:hypothetical protein [Shewanella sp. SE1]|uniref:hypothetical protein n=1 Tax=Shewanella sp. SE1 TaxID=2705014 RepID=UPI00138EF031|nr:hypothetical protein [Shewanella sp. SE1]NDO73061.1 hypothetical protein [Shewanella sp. SE1]